MRIAYWLFGLALATTAHAQMVLPQPASEGIARAQIFDGHVTDTSLYATQNFAFVWGSSHPQSTPPTVSSNYLPYARDLNRSHTLEWYKTNHPDWIVYKEDRTTPAYGFTYANGNDMALDITNPDVREFYYKTYVIASLQAGYPMIALDNIDLTNWDRRSGHFDAGGKWIQQFSGERVDDAYIQTVLDWVQFLTTRLHARGVAVAANLTFPLKNPELLPQMRQLVSMVDIWLDEQGFTIHRDSNIVDDQWQRKFDFLRKLPAGQLYIAINPTTATHLAQASQTQIDWVVANYYLYREKGSMLALTGKDEYGVSIDTPALHINLGHPTGDPTHTGGAWTRTYSKGMVIVNPVSLGSATVSLKKHTTWVDSNGKVYTGKVEVPGNSGIMLTRK